tara:strand:- start:13636 stop:13800 length:165 start_codon:yes stop_codon:yes gene_type:complete
LHGSRTEWPSTQNHQGISSIPNALLADLYPNWEVFFVDFVDVIDHITLPGDRFL